jgi:uncharacterized phiE125 gp8 family phage protein
MYLVRKTAPATALVDLTAAKAHLRVSHTADDTLLGSLITVATDMLDGPDGYLRRALVNQSWYAYCRDFPTGDRWHIPLPPLQSVAAVTYTDRDGVSRTVSTSIYRVITPAGRAGYIERVDGEVWPADVADRDDAVRVEFVAGYGAAATDVPAPIRHAMLLLIGELYAGRGDDGAEAPPVLVAPGTELATKNAATVRALVSRYLWREMA